MRCYTTAAAYGFALSPDGRIVASETDVLVQLWDITTGQKDGTALAGHTATVTNVTFGPDHRTLATASSYDHTVRLWDLPTRTQLGNPITGYTGTSSAFTSGVAFSPDGHTLATPGPAGTIRLWHVTANA